MRKLLAANWKENPKSEAAAVKLFNQTLAGARNGVNVVICPPFIYLEKLAEVLKKNGKKKSFVSLGAQDVFWEERGPYTSEVGPKMLRSLDVKYVIVGHSERRKWLYETDAMVNKKIKLALRDRLKIILCVGEPLAVRKKGIAAARRFVKNQLKKDLRGARLKTRNANIIIAYEPIWAIGTGRSDKPRDASEMADSIKKYLRKNEGLRKAKVLYGGSVNGGNIADFVQLREIDGALVGGASLRAGEFKKIISKIK